MNCPCKAFKIKLLLVSLAILTSLLTLPHAYAMEKDECSVTEIEGDEQSGKRPQVQRCLQPVRKGHGQMRINP